MDREISIQEKRKRKNKLILQVLVVVGCFILLGVVLSMWITPRLDVRKLQIGEVTSGSIEITVTASGKLSPLIEEIIISPVNSRVLEVYKTPGDTVNQGDALLKLDLSSVETEYLQMLDEKEKMKSGEIQARVRLENSLSELNMQIQLKEMQVKQLSVELQGEQYLNGIGMSAADKVRRAELNYEEAKLQLDQLRQKIKNEQENAAAELKVQQLDLAIFEKKLDEKRRVLNDARVLSPIKATLTYIQNQIGAQVSAGDQLGIVSDLTRYKVDCEISDNHRDKMAPGSRVIVNVGSTQLTGIVSSVTPSVTNGLINFTVIPDDSSHPGLRSGLSAEVNILYGILDDVVRIPNEKYMNLGSGDYFLWVIDGDKAVKRKVRLGKASFEYLEVVHGLSAGQRVVLSDMENYRNEDELKLK